MTTETTINTSNTMRLVVIGALVVGAFFGAYKIASAVNGRQAPTSIGTAATAKGSSAAGKPACACCGGSSTPTGNGVSGAQAAGTAAVVGGVQKISVDVSSGTYVPNVLKIKAGIPADITFGRSGGCTAVVQSKDLGFREDLSAGPKTVKLGALKPGTYAFSCSMEMVFGKIVVE